jgi:hypothetical protein
MKSQYLAMALLTIPIIVTYNEPVPNKRQSRNFCLLLQEVFRITGIGKVSMAQSVRTFKEAAAR